MTTPRIDDAQIAEAAFYLWLEEGQPQDRAEDHWYRARLALEGTVTPRRRAAAKPKAAKAAAPKKAANTVSKSKAAKPAAKAAAKPRKAKTTA